MTNLITFFNITELLNHHKHKEIMLTVYILTSLSANYSIGTKIITNTVAIA